MLHSLSTSIDAQSYPSRLHGNPFNTWYTHLQKVRAAEDAWNSRDPDRVALAYTKDSRWRNRTEFMEGRDAIRAFLKRKWGKELDYR